MHRSGTELLTRLLLKLGVYIGDNLDKHFEANTFKQINRLLLAHNGAHWANPEPFLNQVNENNFLISFITPT